MTATMFEQEALSHLRSLGNYAASLCRDEHRTEDLVQDTLLKAFKYCATYKEGTNCRAWLFQICKNTYYNNYRRKRYEPIPVDFQDDAHADRSDRGSDEQRDFRPTLRDESAMLADDALLSDEVLTALKALPSHYQTVLILSDIEGYTYEEVAEFVQAPLGTIRSRIHRARKLVAHRLGDYAQRSGYIPARGRKREQA